MNISNPHKFVIALALALLTASAHADPVVYAYGLFQQFGTANLSTGTFTAIGPGLAEGGGGLVGVGGNLLTLTFAGNLSSINPATGVSHVIGATGLDDCTFATSSCGPTSANGLAGLAGVVYATDFSNNLYTVNPSTGVATLVGPTGIPGIFPHIPFSTNPVDGSTYLFDETLFGSGGNLYATFDEFWLSTDGFTKNFIDNPFLYRIDPTTGLATNLGPTSPQILGAVDVGGQVFVTLGHLDAANPFPGYQSSGTLNLATGATTILTDLDPSTGPLFSLAPVPTPEPASLALVGTGVAGIAALWNKRRRP